MPAATPMPRGPSVLTLYSAADLLTAPGCPVCRYAGEASDRYLGWFAFEGHAEPTAITALCGSLGMCARHTRRLIAQPGAAVRLTAVYRYVVTAARDRLTGGGGPVAACPGCEHDDAAADRALDTLLDGIVDGEALDRCRELGGVCIPHLQAAAGRRPRRAAGWLAETMRETLDAGPPRSGWLAGTDHDAEVRAVLRHALPAAGVPVPGACAACLAAARAERDSLDRLPPPTADGGDPGLALCGGHLADAAAAAGRAGRLQALLAWQAACAGAAARPGAAAFPARWLRAAGRGGSRSPACLPCRAASAAAQRALEAARSAARPARQPLPHAAALCVRHHLALRAADPRAGRALSAGPAAAAGLLIGELAEAFDNSTWARRRGAPAPESAAWRRAAAFLDGAVFGGCPPRDP
jgi:hypothetical protein